MELIDMIILIVMTFVLYTLVQKFINTESFDNNLNKQMENDSDELDDNFQIKNPSKYIDKIVKLNSGLGSGSSSGSSKSKSKPKTQTNPYFVQVQFNDKYRDVLNAFNHMVPSQKQLFNKSDLPVKKVPTDISEVKPIIINFINETNKYIKNESKPEISLDGWFNSYKQQPIQSGWDKQQKKLGLPESLYDDATPIGIPISLIQIDMVEKYTTDNETQYVIYMICGKKNKKQIKIIKNYDPNPDQIVLRLSVIIDKHDINLDRDFFKTDKDLFETLVKIEEISIIGYLTNNSHGSSSSRESFYDFDQGQNNSVTSDKTIIKELIKKKKSYMNDYGKNCSIENSFTPQVWAS